MHTPWGEARAKWQLEEGIFWITTDNHGGILIKKEHARQLLSARAYRIGIPWYDFLAFEQDYAILAVFYEQPHLSPWIEETLSAKLAEDCLRHNYPTYFSDTRDKAPLS